MLARRSLTRLQAAAAIVAAALPATAAAARYSGTTRHADQVTLAVSGARASASFSVTHMTLSAELTGIHVVDWHIQDPAFPDPQRSWVAGSGTQTLGFTTARPLRLTASAYSGSLPTGEPMPTLVLPPARAPRPLRGSLRRRASWRYNDPRTCDREGGCGTTPISGPRHAPPSCPAKQVSVPLTVEEIPRGAGWVLVATFQWSASFDPLWANCPPDIDGIRRPLTLAQPQRVEFAGGIERIARMHRGQSLTLKAQLTRGSSDGSVSPACPTLAGPGHQECAVTDLTLEVKRLG